MSDERPPGLPQLPEDADAAPLSTIVPPWLLTQKVTVPDRVARYVHRPELTDRTMPTQRRLTVLRASGGFGKTVLLAECCRRLRADGVATARQLSTRRTTRRMNKFSRLRTLQDSGILEVEDSRRSGVLAWATSSGVSATRERRS